MRVNECPLSKLHDGGLQKLHSAALGQLSLASLWVTESSTSFSWGKGGNVTSAWWQVTLCDPVFHVISRSSVLYGTQQSWLVDL